MKINRRDLIRTSAALAASAAVDQQLSAATPKNIVIASSNGLKACCARAMAILKSGGDTLDAVVAGVNTVELDPTQHGVGWGGLPNEDGVVELDASVMHGPTRRCGSVASIRNIRTPSKVAKLVMEQTNHVFIFQSHQRQRKHRLARSRFPHNPQRLAFPQRERHVV